MPAVTSGRRQACSWTPAAPSGLAVFVVFTMAISPSFCQREASILRRSSSVTHPASTAAVGDVTASSAELGDLVLRTEVTTSILRPSADSDDEGSAPASRSSASFFQSAMSAAVCFSLHRNCKECGLAR